MEKAMTHNSSSAAKVQKEIASHIAAGADFMQLHQLLTHYKQQGLTAQEVEAELEKLRSSIASELDEDRVLELLDVVRGFCSPLLRLW